MSTVFLNCMEMTPIDCSRAQDILTKLVQVLSPLTLKIVPTSFFLSKRFAMPNREGLFPKKEMRANVCLLKDLTQFQAEIEMLMGDAKTSGKEGTWPKTDSVLPESREKMMQALKSKTPEQKGPATPEQKGAPQLVLPPVSKQAEKLIAQVHVAIAKLTTSKQLKNPEEEPLKEALRKIKPHLDRIVESVSHQEKGSDPITKRGAVFPNRNHPLNASVKNSESETAKEVPNTNAQNDPPKRKKGELSREPLKKESAERTEKSERKIAVNALTGKILISHTPDEVQQVPRTQERTYLPGAPFQPENKNLGPIKKKKKRKGFWFKREEEKEPEE